jgi:site-specific DNA-cytosine methylase
MPEPLRVLIACEFSGVVRRAFRARGHDAWSCDLLPAEDAPQASPAFPHIQGDVRRILNWGSWDLMIAHPPCTHLAVSGARHFAAKQASGVQQEALEFVQTLLDAPIPRIALENPVSIISSRIRKPDQVIQPWQFGHGETKATCLWLKNLPKLVPTHSEKPDLFAEPAPEERDPRVWRLPPGPNRWKERSRTFEGIAAAMAEQWGGSVNPRKEAA